MWKNQRDKKGFTMVELLATIVIIGVLSTMAIVAVSGIIDKSRKSQKESQEKTLEMAARSYLQTYTDRLPKAIGESRKISAQDLKRVKYLKEDLKNSSGEDCMEKSFVIVRKTTKSNYIYQAKLYCGDDIVPGFSDKEGPEIQIHFNGIEKGRIEDVTKVNLSISIEGIRNGGKIIPIEGYSFSLSIKEEKDPSYREVYNSGTLNGNNKEKILIEKPISDYIDITTETLVKAKVVARDINGGYSELESSSMTEGELALDDNTRPTCKKVTGSSTGTWINASSNSTRKITAECSDGSGSGCIREKFSRTWPNENQSDAEYSYIQVKDNAGNVSVDDNYVNDPCSVTENVVNDCRVLVNVDRTYPKIDISSYKLDQDGNLDTSVNAFKSGIITSIGNKKTQENEAIHYDSYKNLVNGWMNQSNYPYGIGYRVKISDTIHLASWKWETNAPKIEDRNSDSFLMYRTGNNSENNSVVYPEIDTNQNNCGNRGDEFTVYFKEEGMRRGRLTVTDKAGNTTIYYIEAYIDYTKPTCSVSISGTKGDNGWYKDTNVSVAMTKSDTGSSRINQFGLSSSTTATYNNKTTGSQGNTTGVTWYGYVMDYAGNTNRCQSESFKADVSSPTCSIEKDGTVGSAGWYKAKDVSLTLKTSDEGSSTILGYDLTKSSNESSINYSNKNSSATQGNTKGVTWYGYVKDQAGNTGKCDSGNLKVDTISPTISSFSVVKSGTTTIIDNQWTNTNVQAKMSGSDSGEYASGIGTWKYLTAPQIQAKPHIQDIGWRDYAGTSIVGTTGISKRLEAFQLNIINSSTSGSIQYAVNNGGFVNAGATAGKEGSSYTIKNVAIKLTGNLADYYDISYRTHRSNVGWVDSEWVSNGTFTKNDKNAVQAIEIKIEKKEDKNSWKSANIDTANYTHTFSSEQNAVNYFILCDAAGNCSSSKSANIKIDTTAPYSFIYGDYFNGATVISDNCVGKFTPKSGIKNCKTHISGWSSGFNYYEADFDNLSGISDHEGKYIHDGGGPKTYDWTSYSKIVWSGTNEAVGTYRDCHSRVKDNAGNVSAEMKMHLYWP